MRTYTHRLGSGTTTAALAHEKRNIHCCAGSVIDSGEQSYRGRGRLEGLTAMVTNADTALGRAVATAFAREGAQVLSHAGSSEGDLTTDEGRSSLVARVARELGRIHVLVVNTAFDWLQTVPPGADVTEHERALRTSLEAASQFTLAVASHVADGGSIVLTAPMRHAHPIEPARALAANVHGIQSISSSLASSLAARRIRVNAIVPGPVNEPRVLAHLSAHARSTFGTETLLGRAAQPIELAPAFVFLAAPKESGFVNGATLEVTGGASAPLPALE